ncbi:conjugal transfer protein TraF [Solimonas sp. SE-A11]|uniref:conjugal transfer protein TraF n=1 Tax=Solimonas sp. SE-A11 TaxID=3054954 RepID=UPI00259D18F9|nr:conjugal transfer protein TraF [Solimonas sp. SE-A11]MDM4770905.1 conjugal transfer protein TraF [Solimonas sp. SE-A11]
MKYSHLLLLVMGIAAAGSAGAGGPPDMNLRAVSAESPRYYQRREDGWFWYRDPRAPAPAAEAPPAPARADPPAPADPREMIQTQRDRLETLLAAAVLQPTARNVEAYMRANAELMQQSSDFADQWQRVLWNSPELDRNLVSPTGQAALLRAEVETEQQDRILTVAAQEYGLVFFFRGSCPYCHQFAPVLKNFTRRYGFSLIDVSLDGGTLPEFPTPRKNFLAASAMQAEEKGVPAVYVINPRTRQIVPAAFGSMGFTELAQRIVYAIQSAAQPRDSVASFEGEVQ